MDGDARASAAADPIDVLERVVRAVGEELATFRRRALDAERRVRELTEQQSAAAAAVPPSLRTRDEELARLRALEVENAELRGRLGEAAERARAVASRIRFARQQDDVAAASEEVG